MESLQEVTKECESYGAKVLPLLADVGKHEEVNRVVKLGLERFGKIDQLVSVAAYRNHLPFFEYTYDEWVSTFAVNVHSTFYLAKAILPGMLERKSGNIIALGSTLSLTSRKNEALETSCKHGLHGLIKALAAEFTPSGIRANLLIVSAIRNKRVNPEKYPWEAAGDDTIGPSGPRVLPMGRRGTSQEVANVALFLASDQSSYISGDRILCSGGKYI
jgi:3-oxoacyl-[acyl-carrier protein] reductase